MTVIDLNYYSLKFGFEHTLYSRLNVWLTRHWISKLLWNIPLPAHSTFRAFVTLNQFSQAKLFCIYIILIKLLWNSLCFTAWFASLQLNSLKYCGNSKLIELVSVAEQFHSYPFDGYIFIFREKLLSRQEHCDFSFMVLWILKAIRESLNVVVATEALALILYSKQKCFFTSNILFCHSIKVFFSNILHFFFCLYKTHSGNFVQIYFSRVVKSGMDIEFKLRMGSFGGNMLKWNTIPRFF